MNKRILSAIVLGMGFCMSGAAYASVGREGWAPSPEASVTVGLLVTGGVVAFLRRRRSSRQG